MQLRFNCSPVVSQLPLPLTSSHTQPSPLVTQQPHWPSLCLSSPQRPPPYGFWTHSSLCLECSHPALCLASSHSTHSSETLPAMAILKKFPRTSLSNFHVWFSSYQLLLFYDLFIILLSLSLACTNLVFLAHCSAPHACRSGWHIADTQYLFNREGKGDRRWNVRCHLMWGPLLCSSVSDHKLAAFCGLRKTASVYRPVCSLARGTGFEFTVEGKNYRACAEKSHLSCTSWFLR